MNNENVCYFCNLNNVDYKTECCNNYNHYSCWAIYSKFIGIGTDCAICFKPLVSCLSDSNLSLIVYDFETFC